MFSRVILLTAVLSAGVRSLPVTSSQMENEDVKVMKCVVEALADVLSRPRPLPVSEDCLLTLRTDDRLVAILRHHSFLRELQDVALGGNQKRAEEETLVQTQDTEETPDRSMLRSLGGPGERSILDQEGRGHVGEGRSQGHLTGEGGGAKRAHSDNEETQTRERKDKKGSEHSEKRDSLKKKSSEEFVEETRSDVLKRNGPKVWSKRARDAQVKKAVAAEETEKRGNAEIPHHSKEDSNQEVDAERRSPEEEELQLIARNTEEREDEGSGSKKLDIESLATIESELENVAQKLHDLSRTDRGQRRA